ncbi:MAG: peptidoglycan DD-metalloendopeptidase family protein [Phascolarctobacterium sp.]|nr:peptidoglycan DD-metalloendopeptidase family protein [Phascolarctobacterium sp.]
MRKGRLTAWLLAFLLALLPLFTSSGFTTEVEEKMAELEDVQRQMEEMDAKRTIAREKAQAASASLNEVVARLAELQKQANTLQDENDRLQDLIDKNQDELDKKKAEHEERMKIYSKRLRNIYIDGQIDYLDVLLGAKDFNDFSSRMYLLQKIVNKDIEMLNIIAKSVAEINARQAELDKEMEEIKVAQAELAEKQTQADELRKERAKILYAAEEAEEESEQEYDRLVALSENISVMLRNLQVPSVGGSGQMMWPCYGEITSYYGWRTHPVFGTTRYHSGMDIAVDYGTPIVAADGGTVVYSGWLGGYGYAVMIDHGGGLVTVYGHNQSLAVSEGQYVNKGQVIAYAGSTGWSTGPHCHFEVRLHGDVTEPLNYLP